MLTLVVSYIHQSDDAAVASFRRTRIGGGNLQYAMDKKLNGKNRTAGQPRGCPAVFLCMGSSEIPTAFAYL